MDKSNRRVDGFTWYAGWLALAILLLGTLFTVLAEVAR